MFPRDPSPRLAEMLPPTLLPNAVLLAAPRPDRMTSLLAACMVYCALGGLLAGTARHMATRPTPITRTVVWGLGPEVLPPVPVGRPPQPVGGGAVPAGVKVVQPVANPNTLPDVVPTGLPTVNHGNEMAGPEDAGQGPYVPSGPAQPGPAGPAAPLQPRAPMEVDFHQIQILQQVAPVYPALARMVKAQGPVELQLTIDTQGVPTDVQVVQGPHPLLINEAVRVARLWRFRPALVNGQAVAATFKLTVAFRLRS